MKSDKRPKTLDIIRASRRGKLSVVKELIETYSQREIKHVVNLTRETNTPLICAAKYGHLDVVKLLIAHGANISHKNREGDTPVSMAARYGHLEILKYLIAYGAIPENQENNSPWLMAAKYGHLEIFKFLLAHRGYDSISIIDEYRIFMSAAEHGHSRVVQYYLDFYKRTGRKTISEFDALTQQGLQSAAIKGHLKVVKQLISNGAYLNPNEDQLKFGHPVLYYAAAEGQLEIVKYLVSVGSDIGYVHRGINILNYIFTAKCDAKKKFDTIQYLVSTALSSGKKLDINNPDIWGSTPLMKAVEFGNLEIVKLLISFGANIDQRNKGDGVTPLLISLNNMWLCGNALVEYLIEIKANPFFHDSRYMPYEQKIKSRLEEYRKEYVIWKKEIMVKNLREEIKGYFGIVPLDIVKYLVDQHIPKYYFTGVK